MIATRLASRHGRANLSGNGLQGLPNTDVGYGRDTLDFGHIRIDGNKFAILIELDDCQ